MNTGVTPVVGGQYSPLIAPPPVYSVARTTGSGKAFEEASGSDRLTTDRVVNTALAMIRRDGVEALNMRALGAELGVTQMAIYHYVPNKEDLFRLMLDSVFLTIEIPHPDSGTWATRLVRLMTSVVDTLGSYPGLSRAMLTEFPPASYARIREAYMQIFGDAGFNSTRALLAYATITSYLVGRLELVNAIKYTGLPADEDRDLDAASSLHSKDYLSFGIGTVVSGLMYSTLVDDPIDMTGP